MFASFFTEFDSQLEKLGVSNYGLSISTLEDVFMKIVDGNEPKKQQLSSEIENQYSTEYHEPKSSSSLQPSSFGS